jgi:hypothetical protein
VLATTDLTDLTDVIVVIPDAPDRLVRALSLFRHVHSVDNFFHFNVEPQNQQKRRHFQRINFSEKLLLFYNILEQPNVNRVFQFQNS